MRSLFFLVSLAVALVALPASAQLGPAGVPGAPGLAETDPSVRPAPPPQPAPPLIEEAPRPTQATECNKANNNKQCKTRPATKGKVQKACKGKTGKACALCTNGRVKNTDCSKAREPVRCEQFQKTREQCKDKLGVEYRQCLRDNLAPQK